MDQGLNNKKAVKLRGIFNLISPEAKKDNKGEAKQRDNESQSHS